ncbi:hypothetical protein ACJX0J_025831, partial [Zea mays]
MCEFGLFIQITSDLRRSILLSTILKKEAAVQIVTAICIYSLFPDLVFYMGIILFFLLTSVVATSRIN